MILSGCSNHSPKIITKTKHHKIYPPSVYLKECQKPSYEGSLNNDIVTYIAELMAAINKCNQDKESLRDWANKPEP